MIIFFKRLLLSIVKYGTDYKTHYGIHGEFCGCSKIGHGIGLGCTNPSHKLNII